MDFQSPFVDLTTENLFEGYRNAIRDFTDRLISHPEVVGLVLLGGIARGGRREFVDKYSDFDMSVFVTANLSAEMLALPYHEMVAKAQSLLPRWLPNFKFMIPKGAMPYEWPIEINVHQQLIEYDEQPHVSWDFGKCDAYGNTAEIVYDPAGRVEALISAKLAKARAELEQHIHKVLSSGRVLLDTIVRQCLVRKTYNAAHDVMNGLLQDVMVAWYAVNDRFPPFTKWRVISLRSLPWTPPDAPARYTDLLLVRAHDAAEVRRRMDGIARMLDELQEHCLATRPGWPSDPYSFAVHHVFTDRQLRDVTTADELASVRGLGQEEKMRVEEWNWHNWRLDDTVRRSDG